jgi:hypothetical protein
MFDTTLTLTISGETAGSACGNLLSQPGWRPVQLDSASMVVCSTTPIDGNTYEISNWWFDTRDINACDMLTRNGGPE